MHCFARVNAGLSRMGCVGSSCTYFKHDFALKGGNSANAWFYESAIFPIFCIANISNRSHIVFLQTRLCVLSISVLVYAKNGISPNRPK